MAQTEDADLSGTEAFVEAKRRWEEKEAAKATAAKAAKAIARARKRRRFHMTVPTMVEFNRRFEQLRQEDSDLNPDDRGFVSERGRKTAWVHLLGLQIRAHAGGTRTFRTCKPQICRAMEKRGRRRETRTVQRNLRRLERMGCIDARHVRKRLMRVRERDCLDITLSFGLPAYGSPPTRTPSLRGGGTSAGGADNGIQDLCRPPPPAGLAAPNGAGLGRSAAPTSTQEGRSEGPIEGSGGLVGSQTPQRADQDREGPEKRSEETLQPYPHPGGEVEWCEAQLALPFVARTATNRNTVHLKAELLRHQYERSRDGR